MRCHYQWMIKIFVFSRSFENSRVFLEKLDCFKPRQLPKGIHINVRGEISVGAASHLIISLFAWSSLSLLLFSFSPILFLVLSPTCPLSFSPLLAPSLLVSLSFSPLFALSRCLPFSLPLSSSFSRSLPYLTSPVFSPSRSLMESSLKTRTQGFQVNLDITKEEISSSTATRYYTPPYSWVWETHHSLNEWRKPI